MSKKRLGELGRLTPGERLLIERRRLGESQEEAADRHGMSSFSYGKAERDQSLAPPANADRLQPHERCLLYRRRTGFTQQRVADELHLSRHWVNNMERGLVSCDTLLWYWEQ